MRTVAPISTLSLLALIGLSSCVKSGQKTPLVTPPLATQIAPSVETGPFIVIGHLEHRDRLQRVYVDALMELGGRLVEEDRHAKAAEVFRRVLARDELHEEALRAMMRSLAEAGERSQALRAYRAFAAKLREELDADPEEETTMLSEQLQTSA